MIKIWDAFNGKLLGQLKGHTSQVLAMGFHPKKSRILVTGANDKTVKVWDIDTFTLLKGNTRILVCLFLTMQNSN